MKVTAVKNMLMAQDMARALKFYQGVFLLEPQFTSEHWSELTYGDCIIALHGGHEGGEHRTTLSLQVDDIDDAVDGIECYGGRIVVAPLRREGEPIIYAEFADAEGNVVMLTQYIGDQ
jgi:predicted enzyme related to lactoylglutathione lyase